MIENCLGDSRGFSERNSRGALLLLKEMYNA
jgi:hypothetical protein